MTRKPNRTAALTNAETCEVLRGADNRAAVSLATSDDRACLVSSASTERATLITRVVADGSLDAPTREGLLALINHRADSIIAAANGQAAAGYRAAEAEAAGAQQRAGALRRQLDSVRAPRPRP